MGAEGEEGHEAGGSPGREQRAAIGPGRFLERLGEVPRLFVDVSALGGYVALTLLTTFAAVYLALSRRRGDALLVLAVAFAGTVGAGEAYMQGHWHCDDLTGLVRLMVANRHLMNDVDSSWSRLSAPLLQAAHWLNRNHRAGSRRNIAAHYDLGNRFFELFLDDTMAYSCGIFRNADSSLREASIAKFDAACSKLALEQGQHLLEIGTGWGGLAIHAARHYGCRVTTTTISREQYEFARACVRWGGVSVQAAWSSAITSWV